MDGIYPIVIDGELAGQLKVTRCGAVTEFDARCKMRPGIVRISVYGGEKEAVLGVLAPEGDSLCLRRRFSRTAMKEFPDCIETVERAGALKERCELLAAERQEEAPVEVEVPENTDDVLWYATPEGELVCFDGKTNYVALPEGDARIAEGNGAYRMIEGKRYFVCALSRGAVIGRLDAE